jgi:hypothetical protein
MGKRLIGPAISTAPQAHYCNRLTIGGYYFAPPRLIPMTVDIARGVLPFCGAGHADLPRNPAFIPRLRPPNWADAPRSQPIIALLLAPRPVFRPLRLTGDFEKIG